jgi:hypothetical protein
MKHILKSIAVVSTMGLAMSGCGLNPFGPGQGGLTLFANIGKAMQKPSAINDNTTEKDQTKAVVTEGKAMAKRLAKMQSVDSDTHIVAHGIADSGAGVYAYWEQALNKPGTEDSDNEWTGIGVVSFTYTGTAPTLTSLDTSLITGIRSFQFIGRVNKTWKGEIDSISLGVSFSNASLSNPVPGMTWAWGKNISGDITKGDGDTASFTLAEANATTYLQEGEGHFLDAHTGRDSDGDPYAFNFTLSVDHKGTFKDYTDNEGTVFFTLPWGKNATDSLHFQILFKPAYEREGWIRDDNNKLRAYFKGNEKTHIGDEIIYYDENEQEVSRE